MPVSEVSLWSSQSLELRMVVWSKATEWSLPSEVLAGDAVPRHQKNLHCTDGVLFLETLKELCTKLKSCQNMSTNKDKLNMWNLVYSIVICIPTITEPLNYLFKTSLGCISRGEWQILHSREEKLVHGMQAVAGKKGVMPANRSLGSKINHQQ